MPKKITYGLTDENLIVHQIGKTFNTSIHLFFQKIYPFSKVNDSKNSLAAAAGGFILCRSEVFNEHNLYDQIKDKIIDDCNIAKN